MKRLKGILCIILCFILLFQLPGSGSIVYADNLTNDVIKEKEAQIAEAKEEKTTLQNNLTDIKKVKEELEASKEDLSNYITQLDASLSDIQAKIDEYKQLITDKQAEIDATTEELDAALEVQTQQYEAMKTRIKFMYEKGDTMYLELVFHATSFGEMLNKAEYIEMLSDYDKRMLDEYVANTEYISLCKEALEEEQGLLEDAQAAVEEEEASLSALISEKETQINKVSYDISNKEQAIKEYEADIAEQNETIQELEKIVAAEKAKLAEANGLKYDGGIFSWPAPSYTRISDDYGYRIHPILGTQQFHNGIDMAAPGGSAILAAYDGKVVAASYSSSMGNYIMIDHGDGLYTIYMHASALYVSAGATVSKGQQIAAVGSTGRSTGNHLHFSVRLNGSYVSPWGYLRS